MTKRKLLVISILLFCNISKAQNNYEIQIYASPTIPEGGTMFELHSNYSTNGIKDTVNGVLPTNNALHETLEITHGFTPWFEVGFYQFTTRNEGMAAAYVGNHIRPRIALPEKYKCPVGLSLSAEFGYQEPKYASDSWTLEIRSIIDKTINKLYMAINPVVDYSFKGTDHTKGSVFSPNAKISYAVTKVVQVGFEYYNSMGPFSDFTPLNQQPHQLAFAFDFDFSPEWELNVGYVRGLTSSVEQDILKVIIGRRIGGKKPVSATPVRKE